jgi:cytochrome c-type biogenesis protein CcmH/NrfG
VQLGRAQNATKNFKEARSALEEAIQINPFNPLIYRLLGDSLYGPRRAGKSAARQSDARQTHDRQ